MFLEEKNEPNARQALREPTLAGFLAFCESKPAGEQYSYIVLEHCAVTQFTGKLLSPPEIKERFGKAAHEAIRASRTFGELARRLREI